MTAYLLRGDARRLPLATGSVQCIVTSPPFWNLRNYGGQVSLWGGREDCEHVFENAPAVRAQTGGTGPASVKQGTHKGNNGTGFVATTATCSLCACWRGELGSERRVQDFIAHLVEVCREVWRVMRPDACFFLNMGDSMGGSGKGPTGRNGLGDQGKRQGFHDQVSAGKPKSLALVPERLAIALSKPYHTGPIKNEVDRAWLGGLVDADGSIGINQQNRHVERGWNETYTPRLAIAQADLPALERCVQITGMGSVRVKERPSIDTRGINSTRTFYEWRLDGQKAARVIRDIYPWLFIKKIQAQIAWTMAVALDESRPSRRGKVPEDEMVRRRALFEASKRLNQRYPTDVPPLIAVPPAEEPGWIVRSRIAWCKAAPMPESVRDRPTSAWEHIWMLTKGPRYYWDADAVREPNTEGTLARHGKGPEAPHHNQRMENEAAVAPGTNRLHRGTLNINGTTNTNGANLRNFWLLPPDPYSGAHFATYPRELVRRCVNAATSEHGACAACGAPWARTTERTPAQVLAPGSEYGNGAGRNDGHRSMLVGASANTTGWTPTCRCGPDAGVRPCVVLDPFSGSGTTAYVAASLGRVGIGVELSQDYIAQARYGRLAQEFLPL